MKTLEQCLQFFGERPASASRELSKNSRRDRKGIFDRSDHALTAGTPKGRVRTDRRKGKQKKVKKTSGQSSILDRLFLPEAPPMQLLLLHTSTAWLTDTCINICSIRSPGIRSDGRLSVPTVNHPTLKVPMHFFMVMPGYRNRYGYQSKLSNCGIKCDHIWSGDHLFVYRCGILHDQ